VLIFLIVLHCCETWSLVELYNLYASQNIIMVIVTEDEVVEASSMHLREEKCIQNFGWKTRREETTWKTYALMR
jgi:hypothetical protein